MQRTVASLALAGLALCWAAPAAADLWYQHYEKAQQAMERRQWEVAVDELNQAIQRRGDSGSRIRTYGMHTTDYFPYLDLGIAYFNLGQLDAALQAFETENRVGAIQDSDVALDRLERYRQETQAALVARANENQQRIDQIVDDSLVEATRLAEQGNLDEAMVAVGRGLAVSPDHPRANALMEKLRVDRRQEEIEREKRQRIEELVAEGTSLLQKGSFDEAANRLRQAVNLKPNDSDIQSLLEQAQSELKAEIAKSTPAAESGFDLESSLREISGLESEGQLDEALTLLQSVLAVAPDNPEARAYESRLLLARDNAELESRATAAAETELAAAADHFSAGRYEDSLAAANRALAFTPGNPDAMALVAKSYQAISRVLLGRDLGGNIPPAIRFADFREQQEDGSLLQIVSQPKFRLTGVVIDNSPVDVQLLDSQDRSLQVETDQQLLGDFYLTEFQLDHELEPGPENLRLIATDSESLTASSEYAVTYVRSRFRSPWFFAFLVLLAGGAIALPLVRRSRRLAQRRHRRFNPYVAGAPVLDESLFVGRDQLIARILQTIHNNSLLLYGERRIGKTSIQHHLRRRLEELDDPVYDFFPVYIDLQGTPEDRFFATIAEDVFQQLGDRISIPNPPSFDDENVAYSYRELVRDLRKIVRQLVETSSKKVKLVLLIDEVDELNEYDPRINQRLRSLFMKSFAENLVAVVSGVEIKKHWEGVGSPWYNFFEELEVLPLNEQEARDLIERPISGVLRLGDGVVESILERTARRPYLIQKMCISLVNHAYEQGSTVITIADLGAITPEIEP
ncbi:MAG: AAA family ATPase [Acidobacteriota bacterium]